MDKYLKNNKELSQIPEDPAKRLLNTYKISAAGSDRLKTAQNTYSLKISNNKINKAPIALRPIVSSLPTELLSIYLNYLVQPYTSLSPFYPKDTTQLLLELRKIN